MAVQLAYRTLVRAVEVWEYAPDQDCLVWGSGTYRELESMRELSPNMTFRQGEGLPGLAWKCQSPVIMHELYSGEFVRAEAARAAGLTCGIGVPFFDNGTIKGVLVFLCDAGDDVQGAFEVWRVNDRYELGLESSYYANLDHFAQLSHFIKFPKGAGLPGEAWQMRFPRLLDSLVDSPSFMRASGARVDGLQVGLAIPVMRSPWDLDSVVVMLSSAYTPLARVFEVWIPTEQGTFALHTGVYGECNELAMVSRATHLTPSSGLVGEVSRRRCPVVTTDCASVEQERSVQINHHGLNVALGIPVTIGQHLVAVVNLFLE